MTRLSREQRQALSQAEGEPIRVEDPDTKAGYVIVPEELFRRMRERLTVEKIDRSLYEFGEFHPAK
jgi:hypothetical protein